MKQKLALTCALVPQPRVLLLDEPTTGVDPVSRREFWDVLAHLSADGLTVIVATPYLDEAERCHRVALMHEGVLHQTGTPTQLRGTIRAKRPELRTQNLGEAEVLLQLDAGEDREIIDVQRFGDRTDLLVSDPARATSIVERILHAAKLDISDIQIDDPTLENTFVATLRSLGGDSFTRFPERLQPQYPPRTSGDRSCRPYERVRLVHRRERCERSDSLWRGVWPARSERSGKNDHDQNALRTAAGNFRADATCGRDRQSAITGCAPADWVHVAEVFALQRSEY